MDITLNESPVRLGRLLVSAEHLCVSDGDAQHRVRPKDMLVLMCLISNAPSVVSRSALLDAAWPRGYVDAAVLGNAISRLRRILDGPDESMIETVPRKGYRLGITVDPVSTQPSPAWDLGSPYRGLRSFNEDYAPVFFGRDAETAEVLSRMKAQARAGRGFMVLLGPSGTGKTSLIDAGIIPALKKSDDPLLKAEWQVLRLHPIDGDPGPTDDLTGRLVRQLQLDEADLARWTRSDRSADALVSAVVAKCQGRPTQPFRFLLVLDPFEAFFAPADNSNGAQEFFGALYELTRSAHFWVIAGLRNSFYSEFCRSASLLAMKHEQGQFDLAAPDSAHLGRIIREPARVAGLSFEKDSDSNTTLDDSVLAFANSHPLILPLLQFTLDELYSACGTDQVMTFEAYEALGGLQGSMARRAEQVYAQLESIVQQELPLVLSRLVRVTGEKEAEFSRRFPLRSVIADTVERRILIDAFIDARLFVSDVIDKKPVVVVAHESVFRYWERARELLDDSRELMALSARVHTASTIWSNKGRTAAYLLASGPANEARALLHSNIVAVTPSEREFIISSAAQIKSRTRRRQMTTVTLACLTALALGLAVAAMFQRHQAQQESERAQLITDFVTGLFELADPVQTVSGDASVKQIVDLGAMQLASGTHQRPLVRAALLQTIGQVYVSLGQYDSASRNLNEALALRQTRAEPVQLAQTLNALGKLHYQLNEFKQAGDAYRKALAALDSGARGTSAEYAKTQNNLGELAAAEGDYDEALRLHRSALHLRERLFGHDSSASASSLQNIAGVLRRNGELVEAEVFYLEAIALQEEHLGIEHAEVGTARANFGLLLTELGRSEDAEEQLRLALVIRQKVYGPNHPQTANSLHNLAALLFNQKDYERAEPVLRESLQLHSQIFGNAHVSVAYSNNNLATLLLDTGRAGEATTHYQQAFEILANVLGEQHPNTALIRANLAKVALANGQAQQALEHVRRSLEVLEGALPDGHWRLALVRSIYASALAQVGDFDGARELLMASKATLLETHGEGSAVVESVNQRLARLDVLVAARP